MQKIFLTTLIALGLSISSMSFSQETTTTEEPAATTEESAATTEKPADETADETANNSEDQDFPVAQDPKDAIGVEYILEEHGDWKIICSNAGEGKKPNCRLYQLLTDGQGNAVAELSIIALENAQQAAAGVSLVTPLGTLLTAQVGMRIDAGAAKRYPFNWCEKLGCVTRFGLTLAELENMKMGNVAVMSITAVAAPKAPLSLNVSLKGFTAGWDALSAE